MEKINARELKDLFIEIKYGNKIAFEKLYNNYNKLIYSIAYSILKNKQDAEDVVQIVFEKLYLIDKEKLPNRNENSWLYSITKNETEDKLRNKKYSIDVNSSLNFINGRTNEKVYYDEMKIGYYIDTYTYKKSKAISILSNIKGEELRKELIKNLTLEDSPYLTVSPIGTNIEIINSNKAILTITFEDLIPDYNVDGGKFEMKVEINSNTVIERKGGRNKIEQLKDADLNIIKIRLDKNTINNEIPIATYFMSSDGN
jgi:RNA polymerase sigma factor (sigma-70 family)